MDAISKTSAGTVEPVPSGTKVPRPEDQDLRQAAREFEAIFLAEMLKHSGLGEARESFGGGVGEAAFSSMMTQEWARSLVDKGGVGIADQLYKAIKQNGGGHV